MYTQRALPPPADFTVQDSRIGQVLADKDGKTIYLYQCNDDAMDQQTCDHPDVSAGVSHGHLRQLRSEVCQATFPYVKAPAGAKADSSLWTVVTIDPNTGKWAKQGDAGAMQVWAYRGRPVYTYGEDLKAGDANGDNYGGVQRSAQRLPGVLGARRLSQQQHRPHRQRSLTRGDN